MLDRQGTQQQRPELLTVNPLVEYKDSKDGVTLDMQENKRYINSTKGTPSTDILAVTVRNFSLVLMKYSLRFLTITVKIPILPFPAVSLVHSGNVMDRIFAVIVHMRVFLCACVCVSVDTM